MTPPKLTLLENADQRRAEDPDQILLERYVKGDVAAFEELYERHKRGVFNFCRRMLVSEAEANEAVQEVFLRVISASESWQPTAKFSTWLYTVTRNLCYDRLRRAKPEKIHLEATALDPVAVLPASGDPTLRGILNSAIAALPEEQREVFLMRAFLEMSFPEIASALKEPVNTTKSRMRLAIASLKRALDRAGISGDRGA